MPAEARSEILIEYSVRGSAITIVERRPWSELVGPEWSTTRVAQLYCSDSNDRRWLYDEVDPAPEVGSLLAAMHEDVTGIFWG